MWWGRIVAVAAVCMLAPLVLGLVGLAIAEVAEDETDQPNWSDGVGGWAGQNSRFEALDPSRSISGVMTHHRRQVSVDRSHRETDRVGANAQCIQSKAV